MSEPLCPQKTPIKLDLEAGQYYWCSCGKSARQPFCDGAHKGSEFSPLAFKLEEKKTVWLCGCKRTAKPPFCDGAHKAL